MGGNLQFHSPDTNQLFSIKAGLCYSSSAHQTTIYCYNTSVTKKKKKTTQHNNNIKCHGADPKSRGQSWIEGKGFMSYRSHLYRGSTEARNDNWKVRIDLKTAWMFELQASRNFRNQRFSTGRKFNLQLYWKHGARDIQIFNRGALTPVRSRELGINGMGLPNWTLDEIRKAPLKMYSFEFGHFPQIFDCNPKFLTLTFRRKMNHPVFGLNQIQEDNIFINS